MRADLPRSVPFDVDMSSSCAAMFWRFDELRPPIAGSRDRRRSIPGLADRSRLGRHRGTYARGTRAGAQSSLTAPRRGAKWSRGEFCHHVHLHHSARSDCFVARDSGALGITRGCGGKQLREWSYGIRSAGDFMQESPSHVAPASGFAEVDLDQGARLPCRKTPNQQMSVPALVAL